MARIKNKTEAKKAEAEKKQSKKENKEDQGLSSEAKRGIVIILLFALALISILGMLNLASNFGQYLDLGLGTIFGWGKFLFPIILVFIAFVLFFPDKYKIRWISWLGLGLFILSFFGLLHIFLETDEMWQAVLDGRGGGFFGLVLGYPFLSVMGMWAALVILFALLVASVIVMFNTPLSYFFGQEGLIRRWLKRIKDFFVNFKNRIVWRKYSQGVVENKEEGQAEKEANPEEQEEKIPFIKREIEPADQGEAEKKEGQLFLPGVSWKKSKKKIVIPIDLLDNKMERPSAGDIEGNKEKIKKTLENFGIPVEMGDINIGPTVTQFTLKPADGIKLTRITTLSNDLALALAAHPIRIEAPIPGKSLVGVEVPNKAFAVVGLKEALNDAEFKKRKDKSSLTVVLGRDVSGNYIYADLDKMPHLLIAGATGSGKSVCINATIASLLFENSPDDLRIVLVDPKRVELTSYNGIPHLLTPVIHDVDKTVNAFRWLVSEMERRFQLFSEVQKRDIHAYNSHVSEEKRVPFIVAIVDELADLMTTSPREMEASIVRLAQMSRAVGIHLILATQRPSVEIITGLIKANITSRIAFAVASVIDSRTILDYSGAEKLLGKGDMLYISANLSKPKRIQGAWLSDKEIERVTNFLKEKGGKPDYDEKIIEKHHQGGGLVGDFGSEDDLLNSDDELVNEAKQIILQAGKASASLLQRRLRVGYARAARILDILEEEGFIGPAFGAKPREVLADDKSYLPEEVEFSEADGEETDENKDEENGQV